MKVSGSSPLISITYTVRFFSFSELVEKIGRKSLIIAEIHDIYQSDSLFQSLPVERCNELSRVSGAYALVDKYGRVLAGYASNLHDEFGYRLRKFYGFLPFSGNEEYDRKIQNKYMIFWIECSDKSLLIKFRDLVTYTIQKLIIENSFVDWLKEG